MTDAPDKITVLGHPCVRWYTDTDGSVVYADEWRGKNGCNSYVSARCSINGVWFIDVHAHGLKVASAVAHSFDGAEQRVRLSLGDIANTIHKLIDSEETDDES